MALEINNDGFFNEIQDEFASPEFIDPNGRLPRIQALRGTSPKTCGFFATISELAKAGWVDFDPDLLIDYTFESSGQTEQGILFQNPRMLVCPKTPLLGFNRTASQEQKMLIIEGVWDRSFKEREEISPLQVYEVLLLNEENQPLHSLPFSYTAKGANQATFAIEWQKLIQEINICHSLTNSIPARPKNALFNSLCVFEPEIKREQVGDKQRAFTCRIAGHTAAKMENWKQLFVGYNSTIKQLAWDGLQPKMELQLPPALPSEEKQLLEVEENKLSVKEAKSDLGFPF